MKLLSIENEKGYLSTNSQTRKEMTEVSAEDIDAAMLLLLGEENCEFDPVTEIANPASKIIYEQLFFAFQDLLKSKPGILSDIDATFEAAEKKYLSKEEEESSV